MLLTGYYTFNIHYPIAFRVRGRLNRQWYFQEMAYGRKLNRWAYPYNPRTPIQQTWRAYHAQAVQNWQALPDEVRAYYNRKLANRQESGYSRYIGLYLTERKKEYNI